MKASRWISLITFLLCVVLFAGCGGGKGGNGGLTSNYILNLTIEPKAGGQVLLTPSGGEYGKNTEVTLTPVANEGYEFSAWAGLTGMK